MVPIFLSYTGIMRDKKMHSCNSHHNMIIMSGRTYDVIWMVFPQQKMFTVLEHYLLSTCVSRAVTGNEWMQWSSG